jgi:hypothetical protein
VDRLTKVDHFIPVKATYKGSQLAELYMARIVCLQEYQRRSCLVEVHSLPQDSGEASMRIRIQSRTLVWLITLRLMDRPKGLIKY